MRRLVAFRCAPPFVGSLDPGRLVLVALATLLGVSCEGAPTAVAPEGALDLTEPWTLVEPDDVGIDGPALEAAADEAGSIERLRSLLVVRNGKLAYERYWGGWTADTLADVRSVTKSVVSVLTGIALEDGDIASLDEPITTFLRSPDYPVRPEHAAITVRHLLTMTAGFDWEEDDTNIYADWIRSDDQVAFLLGRELEHTPGSTFVYNSATTHLLGVVLEEATGMDLEDYADLELFGPMGVERRVWEPVTRGQVNGGAGLDLTPRDMARFGQLLLQDGWSGARSLVPRPWIAEATRRHAPWSIAAGPI
ncbi:MAG: serine hydrolase, partial [Gemmatimonadota bacterium]